MNSESELPLTGLCEDDMTVSKMRDIMENLERRGWGDLPIRVNAWRDWMDYDGEFQCVSLSDNKKEVLIGY